MKQIIVKNCVECPYKERNYKYKVDLCDVEDREIKDANKIPKWCPLEEVSK